MTVAELRDIFVRERVAGRRPTVAILTEDQFREILADLSVKVDAFDPVILYGVQIVTPAQVLNL